MNTEHEFSKDPWDLKHVTAWAAWDIRCCSMNFLYVNHIIARSYNEHTVWRDIFKGQNFHGFHGFASDRENFNREILPTTQTIPFSCNRCGLVSKRWLLVLNVWEFSECLCCTVDKLPKLPHPTDSCLWKYHHSPLFWLMREWRACWKSLLEKENGAATSSCRPMSMMVIGLSLAWQLLVNGWILRYLHKCGIHAPLLQH